MTHIQWTDEAWNPVVGCSPVSEGCRYCYAAQHAIRLAGNPHPNIGPLYEGTSELRGTGSARRAVFTGVVRLVPDRLDAPLRWKKPRRVFVNSMSDLFHEDVPFSYIDQVFAVMALCPQHTFQVLTKRPERMAEYLADDVNDLGARMCEAAYLMLGEQDPGSSPGWPLPNVWLGTSVEDQAAADERIPHLLRCPSAVRFLSCEPLLGPVDLTDLVVDDGTPGEWHIDCLRCDVDPADDPPFFGATIHWCIVGGESGPKARPCDIAWIRSLIQQCSDAGVACFTKQLGARPRDVPPPPPDGQYAPNEKPGQLWDLLFADPKGGDIEEWPEDLRVREFPTTPEAA